MSIYLHVIVKKKASSYTASVTHGKDNVTSRTKWQSKNLKQIPKQKKNNNKNALALHEKNWFPPAR